MDLNPYLDEGYGHLVLVIKLPWPIKDRVFCGLGSAVATWLQVTDMSLEAHTDGSTILTRASALDSGKPITDLTIHFPFPYASSPTIASDTDGYASVALSSNPESWDSYRRFSGIVSQQGQDSALLIVNNHKLSKQMYVADRVHVFSDRYLYQPGEEMRVKGWLRQIGFTPSGDVSWASNEYQKVDFTVEDSRGVLLGQGQRPSRPMALLTSRFDVPVDANAGLGTVRVSMHDDVYESMQFRIEEFRRPEFEASLSVAEGHHLLNDSVPLSTEAKYYGGGVLAGAQVNWRASAHQAHYSPPGWRDFVFGDALPWWWHYWSSNSYDIKAQTLYSELDDQGRHQATLTLASDGETSGAHVLQVQATVQDLSQQTLSASSRILVHPALWYVGGQTPSNVGQVGHPFPLNAVVTDLDGTSVPGQEIVVTTHQIYGGGDRDENNTDSPACARRSTAEPVSCDLVFPEGGLWRIEMSIKDATGRVNTTRIIRWIAGGNRKASSQGEEEPSVKLIQTRTHTNLVMWPRSKSSLP